MVFLAIDGSPTGGGRTERGLQALLASPAREGHDIRLLSIVRDGLETCLHEAEQGDAFAFGSPIYRASYAAPMKQFLDRLPRGRWGEETAPVTGRAVAILATGASDHHFLGLDDFRKVLAGFFAAYVVPPGLYLPRASFAEDDRLTHEAATLAALQGDAWVALAEAIGRDERLPAVVPQV
jgi:FMN reductase